jgi:hypothetical protein
MTAFNVEILQLSFSVHFTTNFKCGSYTLSRKGRYIAWIHVIECLIYLTNQARYNFFTYGVIHKFVLNVITEKSSGLPIHR